MVHCGIILVLCGALWFIAIYCSSLWLKEARQHNFDITCILQEDNPNFILPFEDLKHTQNLVLRL